MEKISDFQTVQKYIAQYNIEENFSTTGLAFQAFRYQKGEMLAEQDKRTNWLQFLVEGSALVYGIREDGSLLPVNVLPAPALIGDFEFSSGGYSPYYSEAQEECLCIALPLEENREKLNMDVKFLHTLLNSYAEKLKVFTYVDAPSQSLEERIMRYFTYVSPTQELKGTEKAAVALRCSRRQLQRVLKKLCEEKKIRKIGRGHYCLM